MEEGESLLVIHIMVRDRGLVGECSFPTPATGRERPVEIIKDEEIWDLTRYP